MAVSTNKINAHLATLRQLAQSGPIDVTKHASQFKKMEGDFVDYVVRKFDIQKDSHIKAMHERMREYVYYTALSEPPQFPIYGVSMDRGMHVFKDRALKFDSVKKLDVLEWAALAYYTKGGDRINDLVRHEADAPLSKRKAFHQEHLDKALAKLQGDPKYTAFAKYYRGARDQVLIGNKQAGDTFTDPAYLSTSSEKRETGAFQYNERDKLAEQKNATFFTLFGKKGVGMEAFSSFPEEKEYLAPRGTEYEVLWRHEDQLVWRNLSAQTGMPVAHYIPRSVVVAQETDTPLEVGTDGSAKALTDAPLKKATTPTTLSNALIDRS